MSLIRDSLMVFLILFFYCNLVFATVENEPYQQMLQEVFRTDLVYPQAVGELQVSIIPAYFKGTDERTLFLPLDFEYGITDSWQVGLFFNLYGVNRSNEGIRGSGIGDLVLGTQYSFMNIFHTNYHLAFSFDVLFPTGNINKGLTDGFQEYEPSIIFARDFPKLNNSQLFGQIGLSLVKSARSTMSMDNNRGGDEEIFGIVFNENEPAAHSVFVNAGYFFPVGNARYVIEANWENNQWNHNGEDNEFYLTPGIVWELPKNWEIALGGSFGLTPTSDKYEIFSRVTFEFDILPEHSHSNPLKNR